MRKITIVVVGSPWFSRIVAHLCRGQAEFEVVGAGSDLRSLVRRSGQPLPELIVTNVKPVSDAIHRVVAAIKQASPSSKLILTCPIDELARAARQCGADAFLRDENLSGSFLRLARAVARRSSAASDGD